MLRPQLPLRVRPRHVAAGTLAIGTTFSAAAFALAAGDAPGGAAPAAPAAAAAVPAAAVPTAKLADRRLRYGQRLVVSGRVQAAAHGTQVALHYKPAGARWRAIDTAHADAAGRYRLAAELRASGEVRVAALSAAAAAGASAQASRAERVSVAGRLVVKRHGHDVRAGAAAKVRGVLLPREAGRTVTVEGRVSGRWRALGRARTRANGHFAAHVVQHRLGTTPLRVRSHGTRATAATHAGAGSISGYRAGLASWYSLYGGPLACGGTLGYAQHGVAHKSLPCGTKVTIRYRGRELTVPVIDRGPFVGGREWDLTGATARALGFDGVGTIWTTV